MLETGERVTYAQQKLLDLIKQRKLQKWCDENELGHTQFYNIAIGRRPITYIAMSLTCHIIAPIEWLFYTDEKFPYKPSLAPQWDWRSFDKCVFSSKHNGEHKKMEKRLGISEIIAYNLFTTHRTAPSPAIIRKCCEIADPIEFFTPTDTQDVSDKRFYPDRGDIVEIDEDAVLVLSKKQFATKNRTIVCCPIVSEGKGVELKYSQIKGFVDCSKIMTRIVKAKPQPKFMETCNEETLSKALATVRKIFEE